MPWVGGFQSFHTAWRTIQGFEAMLWLRKGFGFAGRWTVCEQNQLNQASFEPCGILTRPRVRIEPTLIQEQLPPLREHVINVVDSEMNNRRLLRINLTAGRFGRNPRDCRINGAADLIQLGECVGLLNRCNDLLHPRQDDRSLRPFLEA